MKLLSISIPAYNVEKYIRNILDHSLEIKNREYLEVLIVNDGSSDSTGLIADEYVANNPELFKHIKKENGGHGSAITAGFLNASGKYFYNIDGDDDIHPSEVDKLLDIILDSDADQDCILLNYDRMDDSTGAITHVKNKINLDAGVTYSFSEIYQTATLRMHTMIIKTSILKNGGFKIDEHRFYVDKEYIFYSLPNIKTYVYYDLYLYKYRVGLMNQSMSVNGARKHNPDREFVSFQLCKFYESIKNSCSDELKQYLCQNIAYSYIATINGYLMFKWNDFSIRNRLCLYDREFYRLSPDIYEKVFLEKSLRVNKLRILRTTHYFGWRFVSLLGKTRRNINS